MTLLVMTGDGRELAVECWGPDGGYPVFYLHGMPGSRFGPRPSARDLHLLGIRLVAYDRPGYGGSSRLAGRSVSHAAADIAAIADDLGFDTFSVMGRSGGAPHAMATAALLPDRVENAAALVSLAPFDTDPSELDWFAGMAPSNIEAFGLARDNPAELHKELIQRRSALNGDPHQMLTRLEPELSSADRRIVRELGVRRMLAQNFEAAFGPRKLGSVAQHGAGPAGTGFEGGPVSSLHDTSADDYGSLGWLDDVLSLVRPWGFDPRDIEVPVLLWHGEHDQFSPIEHFHWLTGRIKRVTPVFELDAAHFGVMAAMPGVLRWLVASSKRAAAPTS